MNEEELNEAVRLEMFHRMSLGQRLKVEEMESQGWKLIAIKDADGVALLYNPDNPGRLARVPR